MGRQRRADGRRPTAPSGSPAEDLDLGAAGHGPLTQLHDGPRDVLGEVVLPAGSANLRGYVLENHVIFALEDVIGTVFALCPNEESVIDIPMTEGFPFSHLVCSAK